MVDTDDFIEVSNQLMPHANSKIFPVLKSMLPSSGVDMMSNGYSIIFLCKRAWFYITNTRNGRRNMKRESRHATPTSFLSKA